MYIKSISILLSILLLVCSCKSNEHPKDSSSTLTSNTDLTNKEIPDGSVLVFTKTAGFRHDCIPAGIAMMEQLCKEINVSMFHTEDAGVFCQENMSKFKIIMFLNTTGDILDEEQQKYFARMIDQTAYFMGIHSAADTEHDWPWYGQLVAGYFKDHPNNPNVRKATAVKVMKNLPGAKLLPDRWEREDEWYNYDFVHDDIKVLMNLDETTYEGGTNGIKHPIIWFQKHNSQLVYYNGMGHTIESYSDSLFVGQIRSVLTEFIDVYNKYKIKK